MSIKRPSFYSMIGIYSKKTLEPKDVIDFVAEHLNIPHKKIMTQRRFRELTVARQITYNILRFEYHMILTDIAKIFKKNHASIINGIKKHDNFMATDEEYREQYGEILFLLKLKQHEHGKPISKS